MAIQRTQEDQDRDLAYIIQQLAERFKREPTEDEIYEFIFGTKEQREAIWNKENNA